MFKKDLNSINNEFSEYLKELLKVSDNIIKIDNDILMAKNEYYINTKNRNYTKNRHHVIKNDILIFTANCIKLKSMTRENIKSVKNMKNNLYNVKKDSDSILIDLKKLKEEFINNCDKRAKIKSVILPKIKAYNFKRIMRELALEIAVTLNNCKIRTNIASSKNNAAFIIKDSSIVDACTSTDDVIVKKYVDACTSTDDLIVKNHVNACTSTDDLIVKNHVDACTSTDDLILKNHVDACTSTDDVCTKENEPCTNENDSDIDSEADDSEDDDSEDDDSEDDDDDNEPSNNDNKPSDNGNNDNGNNDNGNKSN